MKHVLCLIMITIALWEIRFFKMPAVCVFADRGVMQSNIRGIENAGKSSSVERMVWNQGYFCTSVFKSGLSVSMGYCIV